ncbi:solute carrier organic anion transporter family member 4C1-like [Dreissena polymorpha]|uniref:solute carrier organic anion transporter family member 4C1-like n=1 Tax=Dreissena polymorpha TaxID=45954 RepID=UPI002264C1F6|nr:solute carrier organic anion transporter family member 4C1-like [Dreissena polymorpha]
MIGIMKAFPKLCRKDPVPAEELVPLALGSDIEADDVMSGHEANASFPHTPLQDGYPVDGVNGDAIYKARPEPEVETRCGYWTCRPLALQKLNNPRALLACMCFFCMAQGFVVNGINNVSTTSVERRFQLPSSRVGIIHSAYDLSAAILGIFISFMGSGRQKAKWLAMASVTMAIGSFVMALPHFTSGLYEYGRDLSMTCNKEDEADFLNLHSSLQHYLYVLVLGQLLHGLGGATLYTVGLSLIDDSVPATSSPMYIGIMNAFATLGPAMGYILGGQLLEIYVDFNRVNIAGVGVTSDDPRWVGAWWVGFVIASMLFLVAAIPISLYGAELPTAKLIRETRISEMHGDDGTLPVAVTSNSRKLSDLRHLPGEILQLLKNPPFLCSTLAVATEGMIASGLSTFMPKFIQNQFGVTAGWAAMLTGFMAVPGAVGGQFFGGFLCKRLKLKVRGCFRVAIVCSSLVVLVSVALLAKCDHSHVAGVTHGYPNSSGSVLPGLTDSCNAGCQCHTELYEPVCDTQAGLQYFSPCHAGCEVRSSDGKSYTSCSCILPSNGSSVSMVTKGKCDNGCKMLYVFLPIIFIAIFLLSTPSPPAVQATLRCVHDKHRTLGLGLKWFIVRLLGTVPGPILFGVIIDSTCVTWREKCGHHASCWIYDNDQLSRNFFLLVVCLKLGAITMFILAHQLYKAPKERAVNYSVQHSANGTPGLNVETVEV